MRLMNYKLYQVPPRGRFLKTETDEGLTRWGEPVIEGKASAVKTAVDESMEYPGGKEPLNIEDHWNVMRRGGFYRGGAIQMNAVAGIDQALWDIKGDTIMHPYTNYSVETFVTRSGFTRGLAATTLQKLGWLPKDCRYKALLPLR